MNTDNKPKPTPEDELARAAKISQLYPQRSAETHSFTHFTANTVEIETSDSKPISWISVIISGLAMALPFIIFEIGVSTLSNTTSTTEAGQLGMLSTLYLLFAVSLAWLTYKHFSKISPITNVSSAIAYWMILLFSIPAILLTKNLLVPHAAPFSIEMINYYLATCAIFIVTTVVITYIIQRQNKRESTNIKAVATFLALPYAVGLLVALLKML